MRTLLPVCLFLLLGCKRAAPPESYAQLATGQSHTCALRADRSAWCWGSGQRGELGENVREVRTAPVRVWGEGSWARLAAGAAHTCGVRSDGSLWCWGVNTSGQLGDSTRVQQRESPTQVGTDTDWLWVSAAHDRTCGIRRPGSLWCWGDNNAGLLPLNDDRTETTTPLRVEADSDFTQVSLGRGHALALRGDKSLWCWGTNFEGQCGLGQVSVRLKPTRVGTANDWVSLSAGGAHSCGIRESGTAWCWGDNRQGQLGDGSRSIRPAPVQIQGLGWTVISAGLGHTCGVRSDGSLWCWGNGDRWQLGDGTQSDHPSAIRVQSDRQWVTVSAGYAHTCAVDQDGSAWCWGEGVGGQIGNSERKQTPRPARVGAP